MPGSSGRLRKQADGGWEWSDDEYDNDKDENQQVGAVNRVCGDRDCDRMYAYF